MADGGDIERRSASFAAAVSELETELDWGLLGRAHCFGDGEGFFAPEQVEAMRETGLRFATDIAGGLEQLSGARSARSLYVGAGVAELVPMLCETIVLEREVLALALDGPELRELGRALTAVSGRVDAMLPRPVVGALEATAPAALGRVSHVWLVSVLTDPEAFPALHDELYERGGTKLATGHGNPAVERKRAREVVGRACDCLEPPALFTTTDEELPFVREACEGRGWSVVAPRAARLSGVVGDAVRCCRVSV